MNHRDVVWAIAAIVALSVSDLAAQGTPTKPHYYNPAWSPDGKQLVFESNRDGNDGVYRINADGTGLVRLTSPDVPSYQPRWSADGRRIVFGSNTEGRGQIFLMNADGSNLVRLTNERGSHFLPSFSPDGRWVTFGVQYPQVRRDVYYVAVVGADGSQLRVLTDSTSSNEGPHWSRDGSRIEFTRFGLVRRKEGEPVQKFSKRRQATEQAMAMGPEDKTPSVVSGSADAEAVEEGSELSPDKRWLAYTKETDGFGGLYIKEVATGRERLLVGGPPSPRK